MVSMNKLTAMSLSDLKELQEEIDHAFKKRASEELVFAEKRVNELREMIGLKKRPASKLPDTPKRRRRLMEIPE